MGILSAIRVAVDALFVNKGRTALTSLGIVIGIGAVIAIVSAGEGARSRLDDRLESYGKNLILIKPGISTMAGTIPGNASLTRADAEAIRKEVGMLLVGVSANQMRQRIVSGKGVSWLTHIVGAMPDLQRIRDWKVRYGRFYDDDDLKKVAPVCLIGETIRRKLFPNHPNPVGEWVRIDNLRLKIIGVLGEKGRALTGDDQDNQLFLPLTTLQQKLVGEERIDIMLASARSQDLIDRAKQEITRVMRERRRVKGGLTGTEDYSVHSVQEMTELAVFLTQTMQWLVAVIASISLLVGGIGIMNIMLVSVTERTHEIGLRVAVGATPDDVLMQFLLEAVTLALLGGTLGVTLGIIAAMSLAYLASWPLVISPFMVFLAFVVSAGVGIFFGYYPAWKASRLEPIDALRYE